MNATELVERKMDSSDGEEICLTVVLRSGPADIEALFQSCGLGLWSLPGGHKQKNESPEEGAARELREETGLITTVDYMTHVNNHPIRNKPATVFYAVVDKEANIVPGDDVTELRWVPITAMDDINEIDQNLVQLAVKHVHDPEWTVEETEAVMEGMEHATLMFPITAVTERGTNGLFIVFEGDNLRPYIKAADDWFQEQGRNTRIIPSALTVPMQQALTNARNLRKLTGLTEAIIKASDLIYRWENEVRFWLGSDLVVLCEGFGAADQKQALRRGVPPDVVQVLYKWLPKPDMQFFIEGEPVATVMETLKNAVQKSSEAG